MKDSRTLRITGDERGFTILEVVIAMIIISILTLVMMPTVTNRSNQARTTAAEHDMQALAEAESRASIDMGYYVVPWRLNNVIASSQETYLNTRSDDQTLLGYTGFDDMFINTVSLDVPGNVNQLYESFIDDETAFGWRGPYLNFRKDDNGNNWPDDPWGNDYLLFTKAGGMFPPDPPVGTDDADDGFVITGPDYIDNNGATVTGISPLNGIFDRPTWISLGPNGLPGNGSTPVVDETSQGFYGNGDDLVLPFEGFDGAP